MAHEPRPRQLSQHEIEQVIDAVERTGRHFTISDTPPAIQWLRKWWWKISLIAMAEGAGHILHELVARGWRP